MRIAVGSDHAGFKLKSAVVAHLQKTGVDVIDKGCHSSDRCVRQPQLDVVKAPSSGCAGEGGAHRPPALHARV